MARIFLNNGIAPLAYTAQGVQGVSLQVDAGTAADVGGDGFENNRDHFYGFLCYSLVKQDADVANGGGGVWGGNLEALFALRLPIKCTGITGERLSLDAAVSLPSYASGGLPVCLDAEGNALADVNSEDALLRLCVTNELSAAEMAILDGRVTMPLVPEGGEHNLGTADDRFGTIYAGDGNFSGAVQVSGVLTANANLVVRGELRPTNGIVLDDDNGGRINQKLPNIQNAPETPKTIFEFPKDEGETGANPPLIIATREHVAEQIGDISLVSAHFADAKPMIPVLTTGTQAVGGDFYNAYNGNVRVANRTDNGVNFRCRLPGGEKDAPIGFRIVYKCDEWICAPEGTAGETRWKQTRGAVQIFDGGAQGAGEGVHQLDYKIGNAGPRWAFSEFCKIWVRVGDVPTTASMPTTPSVILVEDFVDDGAIIANAGGNLVSLHDITDTTFFFDQNNDNAKLLKIWGEY